LPRLRLTPQNRSFFDLFRKASTNVVEIPSLLVELLSTFPARNGEVIPRIKDREHDGDDVTHEIVDLLNRTFVTPFDRDDMYRLAGALDDICDLVDEAADDLELFGVKVIPDTANQQADVILRCAVELNEAIGLLEGFRDSSKHLTRLRALEDEGDRIVRQAVAGLFRSGQDPISAIRWKEIHE
jgi:uncharacterized protein Yka (UPF0111/DUF47 family)